MTSAFSYTFEGGSVEIPSVDVAVAVKPVQKSRKAKREEAVKEYQTSASLLLGEVYTPSKVLDVRFIKEVPTAKLPFKASTAAACSDVYSVESYTIYPGETVLVSTGLKVAEIPAGHKIEVYDRSGFGAKGIHLGNGVGQVDEDYRGTLKIILHNANKPLPWYKKLLGKKEEGFVVNVGDRIGQIALEEVIPVAYSFTETFSETTRNAGGFGSTGLI